MSESANKPPKPENQNPDQNSSNLKQLESQLVSLNFMIKNTQSEVIKLQRLLARQQTHQDESDKKLTLLQKEHKAGQENQGKLASVTQIFWFAQIGTVIITLLLVMLLKGVLIGSPTTSQQSLNTNNNPSESPQPDPEE